LIVDFLKVATRKAGTNEGGGGGRGEDQRMRVKREDLVV
jgi:hypothetical protein